MFFGENNSVDRQPAFRLRIVKPKENENHVCGQSKRK
jgi:hypothetical protein